MRESRRTRRPSVHEQQTASIGRATTRTTTRTTTSNIFTGHQIPDNPVRACQDHVYTQNEPLLHESFLVPPSAHAAMKNGSTPIYTGLFDAGTFSTTTSIVVGDPADLLFKEQAGREKMFGRDMPEFRAITACSNEAVHLTPFVNDDKTTVGMDVKMVPGTYDVKTRYKIVGNTKVVHQVILTKIDF